jgi:hypothetical protein
VKRKEAKKVSEVLEASFERLIRDPITFLEAHDLIFRNMRIITAADQRLLDKISKQYTKANKRKKK